MLADMRIRIGRPALTGAGRRVLLGLGTAALAPVVAGAVVGIDPGRFGLSTTPLVLHAVSFRGPMALGLTAAGVGTAWTLRLGRRPRSVPWRRLSAGGVLLAAGLGQVAILIHRGVVGRPTPDHADLVVVSLNTLGGAATAGQIAALVEKELAGATGAMLALPETSNAIARETAALLSARGHRFQVFSTTQGPRPLDTTSLLISDELGAYRQRRAPTLLLGAVLAEPADASGPILAAVHPGAPTSRVGYPRWRSDVAKAVGMCRGQPGSIVAGDFNACVDHQMMRDLEPCFDAATRAGRGAMGTWPAHFPSLLAAPIDHVLVNGRYTVLGARTRRVGRSDHRAVIVRLSRAGHGEKSGPACEESGPVTEDSSNGP